MLFRSDSALFDALIAAHAQPEWLVWSNVSPDACSGFDAVMLRSTWDYPDDREAFLTWVDSVPSCVVNSPALVRWNTDKSYLVELAVAGVPTVPTVVIESAEQHWSPPSGTEAFVVKPRVGAGSKGVRRFESMHDEGLARDYVASMVAAGRSVLIQPYLRSVDEGSETALIYLGGGFSHAVSKGPMLTEGDERDVVEGLYLAEDIAARVPSGAQRDVAERTLAAVAGMVGGTAYARVDVVDDDDGNPVLLELEVVEPSLYWGFRSGSAALMASTILGTIGG